MRKRIPVILAGCLLAIGLCGAAVTGPLEDAASAREHKDFGAALRLLRPLADQGDAAAQEALGQMYQNGEGAPLDAAVAAAWFRKAADQGRAGAQESLGFMYEFGAGVPADKAEAARWLKKAADQGDDAAQEELRNVVR